MMSKRRRNGSSPRQTSDENTADDNIDGSRENKLVLKRLRLDNEMELDDIGVLMIPRRPASSGTLKSPESKSPTCLQKRQFDESDGITKPINRSLRTYLRRNFVKLKAELDPDGILDRLCELDVMDDKDKDTIREADFRVRKCDILLKTLVRYSKKIQEGDATLVLSIKDSLEKEKCGHLFESFTVDSATKTQDKMELTPKTVSYDWKEKLSIFESVKGDEVNPKYIIDSLLENEVIDFDEHDNIEDIPFKPEKLKYLIKYIQKKSFLEYENFVMVIEKEYPHLSDFFRKDETMPLSAAPKITVTNISTAISSSYEIVEQTELKLSLCGNGEEIEQMVVDDNSNEANEGVTEEMMDFAAFDTEKWEFSSIRMVLKTLSKRSQMLLLERLKSSPNSLEKIIQHIFTSEHYRQLSAKNISQVDFKIKVHWPDCAISREDIAIHYCLLKENIEPKHFTDMLKSSNTTGELIENIQMSATRPLRCKEFLLYLVNDENSAIDCFYATLLKLKMTDVISVILDPMRQTTQRMCSCKLSKRIIVKKYSKLLMEMSQIEKILLTFEEFPGFDDSSKTWFHNLRTRREKADTHSQNTLDRGEKASASTINRAEEAKVDAFLRQILDIPDDGIAVCLLEKELRRTNQQKLLQTVLEISSPTKEYVLTSDDIERNRTFLQNELEPRRFLDMLTGIEGMEDVKDKIFSTASRQTRCKEFLDAIAKDRVALEKFGSELKRLQLTQITKFLMESRLQGSGENKLNNGDIKRNSGFIQEEIEPRKFLNMLRRIENTDDVIEKILSSSPRRVRCSRFYEFLLNADGVVLQKFQEELDRLKMSSVIKFLINSRPERFQDTSSIKEALTDSYRCIIDEIEPRHLQNIFVERQVYTVDEFSRICDSASRRGRAVCLMQTIMKGPVSRSYCLINALEAEGYVSLVKSIRKELHTYKECPRLYKILTCGQEDHFVIEGQFTIDYAQVQKQGEATAFGEEIRLPSQLVDTTTYVKKWIKDHVGMAECDNLNTGDDQTPSTSNESPDTFEDVASNSVSESGHLRRKSGLSSTSSTNTHCLIVYASKVQLPSPFCPNESSGSDSHIYNRLEETRDKLSDTICSRIIIKSRAGSTNSDETIPYADESQNFATSKHENND